MTSRVDFTSPLWWKRTIINTVFDAAKVLTGAVSVYAFLYWKNTQPKIDLELQQKMKGNPDTTYQVCLSFSNITPETKEAIRSQLNYRRDIPIISPFTLKGCYTWRQVVLFIDNKNLKAVSDA